MKATSRMHRRTMNTSMVLALLSVVGCTPPGQTDGSASLVAALGPSQGGGAYVRTDLVADTAGPAANVDPNLVNPWGIAFGPDTYAWVADNRTGVATLYDGAGVAQSLVVTIPPPPGGKGPSSPTGIVFNGSDGFVITDGTNSGPARFIFVTEDGTISGWSPAVPPPGPSTQAFIAVNNSEPVIYKGVALARLETEEGDNNDNNSDKATAQGRDSNVADESEADGSTVRRLYAADFHNAKIDVFDSNFAPVSVPGNFADPTIPAGFAPFNISKIHGRLFVTYAMQDAAAHDNVNGPGLGFVNIFDADGVLVRRLISQGELNAPWGLALAPEDFGPFGEKLLVGNFGDGKINAYRIRTGEFVGTLQDASSAPIVIDGLWAIVFGNGAHDQSRNTLFFSAGPNEESNGLYGKIEATGGGDDHENGDDENDKDDDDNGNENEQ